MRNLVSSLAPRKYKISLQIYSPAACVIFVFMDLPIVSVHEYLQYCFCAGGCFRPRQYVCVYVYINTSLAEVLECIYVKCIKCSLKGQGHEIRMGKKWYGSMGLV